ncbi:SDR family NAD(P)-dependent oxidoreductase [Tsukamurella sp. 8F]|uniref:type I polyketide synthase n=1 Tax=unclassified Tsukamurella TaxID=2633480 RepID=UPI0023B8C289|nr:MULTISPECIES: type I polyketide synthase [unclassified Tsukamurella]MDF0530312.1 SDR family NAD(P)-dependent oxidoreductase [Tsukamurella sp. 8J]MDF0587609.1 SDR family NAD(P)-dependent oxidoreductase [Tsukamurella sp. 8F]
MVNIAIVGIGCQFPGGITDPESFWDFIVGKGDAVVEIPSSRWDVERYYDPDPSAPGRMYTRHAAFVDSPLEQFDPDFFGISRREAASLDPQQRRLLQVAWDALDDAGIAGKVAGRSVGTFMGGFTNDNAVGKASSHSLDRIDNFAATSASQTLLANRLSHALDLRGPSMTVDTACSSSLVATHLGVRALVDGECEVALVGGSNVIFQPETFITMCKGRFLSVDGRCKSFDASADGYGRGEGVGVVVLKQLEQAQRDGDRIYAVIRGSAVNQDGRTLALPVPNPDSQYELAIKVCRQAGVDPGDVGYVEAHGTGTGVGDPLEAEALGRAYGKADGRAHRLRIGSVKNNFGHTEAAAGVAGLIKAALTVRAGKVAPQAFLENPNPNIEFDDLGLTVPLEPEDLHGRCAAVNSFGYGGTNAHVLVERAPESAPSAPHRDGVRVFPVSARSEESLRGLARRYSELVTPNGDGAVDVSELKTAVTSRRAHHFLRRGFVFTDADDLGSQLAAFGSGDGRVPDRVLVEGVHAPVFVFSGMGPQWWGMGRDLLGEPGRFRDTAHAIDREFRELSGWSILKELQADQASSKVTRTDIAQPANFLIQVALADHFSGFGVRPVAVVGHSVGEVAAAYVCGALSLTDALKVSYHRSRLQALTAGTGGMLAVGLSVDEARRRCAPFGEAVSIAAVNGAATVTLAGLDEAIEAVRTELTGDGVFARRLRVEVPYHSRLMDPILPDLAEALDGLTPREASIPLYSTVTGGLIDGPTAADPQYWCRNVRETVRFADAIENLVDEHFRVFLEVGPHPVLAGNIREVLVRNSLAGAVVPTLHRDKGADTAVLDALAELYQAGAVDHPGDATVYDEASTGHMDLPRYPWAHIDVWEEDPRTLGYRYGDANRYALLGDRTDSLDSEWEVTLAPANLPWLRDHNVGGAVVLPGAAYIDAALAAARQRGGGQGCGVDALAFTAPLVVADHDVPVMRVAVEAASKRVTIKSRSAHGDIWTIHSWGRLVEIESGAAKIDVPQASAEDIVLGHDELYTAMAALGLTYGPAFQRIRQAYVTGDSTCVADLDATGLAEGDFVPAAPHVVHPALTDAALQCAAVLLATGEATDERPIAYVPAAVERVRFYREVPAEVRAVVTLVSTSPLRVDAALVGDDGDVVLAMHGVEFAPIGVGADGGGDLERLFYERRWDEIADDAENEPVGTGLAVNAVVSVGPGADTIHEALAGSRAIDIDWSADVDDAELARAVTERLAETHERAGYLRIAVVPGAGMEAPELVYRVSVFARTLQGAVIDRFDSDAGRFDVRVVVITTAGVVADGDTDLDPAHAALIGLRRTLANELSPIVWTSIDVDASVSAPTLAAELSRDADPAADEIRLRGTRRSAEALVRSSKDLASPWDLPVPAVDEDVAYEVVLPRTRLLKDLALRECPRPTPGPREVEVRVDTVGLNYKDALKVLGILSERQLAGTYFGVVPGMEGYGTVTRVGSEVTDIAPGDLMAMATRDILRRYAIVDLDGGGSWVCRPPGELKEDIDFDPLAIGSGLPFLTAFYSFGSLAHLEPGETVLIHGAAGGMGMAAVQVALKMGATVFATASTDERRDEVRRLGVEHVFDSRSSAFVEQILARTDGVGVDVVYNSMPGEVINQNLTAAAEFARIIELGKADVYFGGVMDLRPFAKNLAFYAVDMDRLLAARPTKFKALMREAVEFLSRGEVVPLPYARYPISELASAFEVVLRGSQVGRVVLDMRGEAPDLLPQRPPTLPVSSRATYLITGGLGAFGLATARALVARGAKRIVLAGRRGVPDEEVSRYLELVARRGVEIICAAVDISDRDSVATLLDDIADTDRPLRGVFHTAGVIDDQPVADMTYDAVRSVLAPKIAGALALDAEISRRSWELDAFVLYSSISAITGTVPQAAYAAANAALDSFAAWRRSRGLAATSVNWGAMSGGGMAENSLAVTKYLELLGFNPIDLDEGAGLLFEASRFDLSNMVIADVDWSTWRVSARAAAQSARFAAVVDEEPPSSQAVAARQAILGLPDEERVPAVVKVIVQQLSEVLGIEEEGIDTKGPIADLGIDSVMAVEFGARVQKQLDIQVTMFQFTGDLTIEAIGSRVVKLIAQEQEQVEGA